MMNLHTHISFTAAVEAKPGCYRLWEQLGLEGVCMSQEEIDE